jgi:hypothetical protein
MRRYKLSLIRGVKKTIGMRKGKLLEYNVQIIPGLPTEVENLETLSL